MSAPIFPNEPIRVPSDRVPFSAWESDDFDEGDPDERSCQSCGGDGFADCDDPMQCMSEHIVGSGYVVDVRCPNCGGSGNAKDQRVW